MKNQTDDSAKQDLVDRAFGSPAIPDPTAWVDEHYFLANFANTLVHLQEHLSDDCCEIGESAESCQTRLSLDAKIRDILRANFSDDCWEYVESLL
jgi:phage gp36-like protein